MEVGCDDGLIWLVEDALEQVKQTFSISCDINGNHIKHLTEDNIKEQLRWGLLCASYNGQIEIVKYLIEQGAVPDKLVYIWAYDNPRVPDVRKKEICKLLRYHSKLLRYHRKLSQVSCLK